MAVDEYMQPDEAPQAASVHGSDMNQASEHGWTAKTAFDYESYKLTGEDPQYHAEAQVFEWNDNYGDVAPEDPDLEKKLYGNEFKMRIGAHMENLVFEVNYEGPEKLILIEKFSDAGLHPVMLSNIQKCGYVEPTIIQKYTIPAVMKGYDVVASSQTGSGKTAAYMIPVISKLMGKAKKLGAARPPAIDYVFRRDWVRAEPLVVIVVPTRELAMQIFDEARRMCYRSRLRPSVLYGGRPTRNIQEDLGKGCDVLIATPGRLCDFMDQPDRLSLGRVKFTIVDEADEMLNDDWTAELEKIMGGGDNNHDADHVFLMFSATFPKAAREIARQYMAADFLRIRVGRPGSSHKNISQDVIFVDRDKKREAVYDLLNSVEPSRTMIFCNSKRAVDLLDDYLYNRELPTTSIHSDRTQREREDAIRAFRAGKAPILITTGVSARGWDVAGVDHIINYDLPSTMYGGIQEYIHRIGRTARIGHKGRATSFYNDDNEDIAQDLVNVLVECESEVPEFLSHLTPEEGKIDFNDDSGDEGEDAGGDAGEAGGWGAGPDQTNDTNTEAKEEEGAFTADGNVDGSGQAW